jgi:hypothetical protein
MHDDSPADLTDPTLEQKSMGPMLR